MRRLVVVFSVLFAACGQSAPSEAPATSSAGSALADASAVAPMPPAPAAVSVDPARGAVLPAEKAQTLAKQCSRISPGPVVGTWQPSLDDIKALEAGLGVELATQLMPEDGAKPDDYYRQYAGLLVGGGRRIIYVNGIHRSAVERAPEAQRESWKTEPAIICDGGSITFGVEYDPVTRKFDKFAFNGRI
jgi:hypothetical protein